LIPYIGESLPAWFDVFAMTALTSHPLYDWYIFITDAQIRSVPSNVKVIQLTRVQLYKRMATLDLMSNISPSQKLETLFEKLIDKYPYVLVEFKPCLGFIFSEYISSYSHWAYADLDTLLGRIDLLITPEHLQAYDIITVSFGDNNRLYMRGQLTIHRNTEVVNNLWRNCSHLNRIGQRLDKYFNGDDNSHKWSFQSAEGCYSRAVMDRKDLKILITPSQVTDAYRASLFDRESYIVGGAILKCYESPIDTEDYTSIESFLKPQRYTHSRSYGI